MTPTTNPTSIAVYGDNSPAEESVQRSGHASAGDPSSGSDSTDSEFLARRTTDQSLAGHSRSLVNHARHSARAVDPVRSIPVGGDFAPTHIQWRCASGQSVAGDSPARISPVATPGPDNLISSEAAFPEAGAVGEAPQITAETDSLYSGSDAELEQLLKNLACLERAEDILSPQELEEIRRSFDEITVATNTEEVGVANIISDSPAESLNVSHRSHDSRLEEVASGLREVAAAVEEEEALQQMAEELQLLQLITNLS